MSSNHLNQRLRSQLGNGYPAPLNKKSRVQDEYIKNLQQQIYLLELESRYMKTPNGDQNNPALAQAQAQLAVAVASGNPVSIAASKQNLARISMASLNNLNQSPIDTRFNENMDKEKSKRKELEVRIKDLEREKNELMADIKSLKDRHISEKDKIYGDLIAARKKFESAESDCARAQVSYERLLHEKEALEAKEAEAYEESKKYKDSVSEQLLINKNLKARIEQLMQDNGSLETDLQKAKATITNFKIEEFSNRIKTLESEKIDLQTLVKQMETTRLQENHLKSRIEQDCKDLIRTNVELRNQLEELKETTAKELGLREEKKTKSQEQAKAEETIRSDLARYKDDLYMLQVTMEMKEKEIAELAQKLKNVESNNTKLSEAKILLSEKLTAAETRIRNQELEIIQLGQDKSLLIDDVAELRNNSDVRAHKIKALTAENTKLSAEVDKYRRDISQIQEFSALIDQAETNGQNYLQMMRNLKSYLAVGGDHSQGHEVTI